MKKKYFIRKTFFIYQICLILIFAIYLLIMNLIPGDEKRDITFTLVYGIAIGLVGFIAIALNSGTVIFGEDGFTYKEHLFSKPANFKYEDMEEIEARYYSDSGGRYNHSGPTVLVQFKKRKKYDFMSEIDYGIIEHLLEKKPERCQVKVDFVNLREFPEKHRELVKDYLTGAQKEKIEELLRKKKPLKSKFKKEQETIMKPNDSNSNDE